MSEHQAPISHRESAATILARPWRVGGSTGRAIYCWPGDDDSVIGMMDTRELAWTVTADHNWAITRQQDYANACRALDLTAEGDR